MFHHFDIFKEFLSDISHAMISKLTNVEICSNPIYLNSASGRILISLLVPVVPGAPQNVKVEVINSTSIKVTWTPPDEKERHGIIRGYQIHVQNVNRVRTKECQRVV